MKRFPLSFKVIACALALSLTVVVLNIFTTDDEVLLKEALEAIKHEYGAFYIPSKSIDEVTLKEVYGVDVELVEAYVGECAYMSTHVDVFLGIKAKRGQVNTVEEQLQQYRMSLVQKYENDSVKRAKVEASKVQRYGDLVFFMILGQNSDTLVSDEHAFLEKAESEMKRGERALEKVFHK